MPAAKEKETWPKQLDDGSWLTSDNMRFVTANPDNADRTAEKAASHQERVDANKGKKS